MHPECRLLMLEKDGCVGGVWNARRLYDGFWSQTGLSMAEFSDMPLRLSPGEETRDDLFPAKHVTQYLEDYVDKHIYNGPSIRDRTVFNCNVFKAEKIQGIWNVYGGHDTANPDVYRAPKLMVALGLTSEPMTPGFPGQARFKGPIIHQEGFGQSSVLSSPDVRHVTVLGGAKSAADMVYDCAKAGKSVSWIIRDSGNGPAAFAGTAAPGRYKNSPELASARAFQTLSPSIFNPRSWWTYFLHGTSLGRILLSLIWNSADKGIRDSARFHDRAGARKGFEKLLPSVS